MDRVKVELSWQLGDGKQYTGVFAVPVIVGRQVDCTLSIDHTTLSRRHFKIDALPDSHVLMGTDLGSANGSFCNGEPVRGHTTLNVGDYVTLGALKFKIEHIFGRQSDEARDVGTNLQEPTLEELSPEKLALNLVERVRQRLRDEGDVPTHQLDKLILGWLKQELTKLEYTQEILAQVQKRAHAELLGLGALQDLIEDDSISEIMVNGPTQLYVERQGKLIHLEHSFRSEGALRQIIERIVMPLGRRIDEASPMVDARLPDGSRVNAIIPPLALGGSVLTIRKFRKQRLKLDDMIASGAMSQALADFLANAIELRCNVVVSGGTGTGKTTLLNLLSDFIPLEERIITIEDSAELQLSQPHVVRMETRPANAEGAGQVSIRDLVKNALRMRPDRIVVGECRGAEALDMLQAMNTGHDGSLTTVHANSVRDAIARIEVMCLMADLGLPHRAIREQIVRAVDLVVQIARFKDGKRRLVQVSEVHGLEGDVVVMQTLYEYDRQKDQHVFQGFAPKFIGKRAH